MVVIVSICDRLFFATAKNGMGVMGVSGASGSFKSVGLLQIVSFRGSFSSSDSLSCVRVGTSTSWLCILGIGFNR